MNQYSVICDHIASRLSNHTIKYFGSPSALSPSIMEMRLSLLVILFVLLSTAASTLSQNDEVVCPDKYGFIRHPDCRYYYECVNYIPELRICEGGRYFNIRIGACDFPQNVPDCLGGTNQPLPPTTELPPETTTEYPTTEAPTPDPTTTEREETSTTMEPTMEPSTQEPTEPTTEGPLCPPTGVHSFPFPGNCSLYIKCFNGIPQVIDCAPGLIFDKNDLICKLEADAECDEEGPVRCRSNEYEIYPHDSSCSKYYECFNREVFETACAANTYFDARPDIFHCNVPQEALCNSECPATGTVYQAIRLRGCRWYKICQDGRSANYECTGERIYDGTLSRCVNPDSYTCPYS